ncbi:MAG: right-handed parallel beta-helix repeat-containing protein [Clostridia bacterium]|nr:right-handed parallel beta-helix repeat-containing protein [Clostridia bacterium]
MIELYKKVIIAISVVCMTFFAVSCGGEVVESGSKGGDEEKDATKYLVLPSAPEYGEIAEEVFQSDYKTYYFDAQGGDDQNSGLTAASPKKSLTSITDIIQSVGDRYPLRILLKRGTTFYGNLKLTGYKATKERPFILDAYGEGDGYPVILGSGTKTTFTNVLHLEEDNTRILNIEITGRDCARGIYIFPRKGGVYENIVVDGCFVHDVNWTWNYDTEPDKTDPDDIDPESVTPATEVNRYRRLYGGICVFTGDVTNSLGAPVTFRNIWINNNKVEQVSHLGINFYNYWVNRPGVGYGYNKYVDDSSEHNDYRTGLGYFPMENVVVSGNYTNCIGGDGIVVAGADNVWLEKNTSYKSNYLGRAGFWNGGIWLHNVRTGYYQYNEAAYTYLRHGSSDGEGFDIDNTCENIYMQYNYSHHNEGGGMLICNQETSMLKFSPDGEPSEEGVKRYKGKWENNYVRNNLFVNNGNPSGRTDAYKRSAFLTVARSVNDVVFENNTVVVSGEIKNQHIIDCEDNVLATGHIYRNNIFYCQNPSAGAVIYIPTLKNPVFENNLYYNIKNGDPLYGELAFSDDEKAILGVDPKISVTADAKGYEKAFSFAGAEPSLYDRGERIAIMLKYDFKGDDATGKNYLGAFSGLN